MQLFLKRAWLKLQLWYWSVVAEGREARVYRQPGAPWLAKAHARNELNQARLRLHTLQRALALLEMNH